MVKKASSSSVYPAAMGQPAPFAGGADEETNRRILELQDNISGLLDLIAGLRQEVDAIRVFTDNPQKVLKLPRFVNGAGIEIAQTPKQIRISLATLAASVVPGRVKSLVEGNSYLIDIYTDGIAEDATYLDTEALVVNAIDGQVLAEDTLVMVFGTFGASFQCYTVGDSRMPVGAGVIRSKVGGKTYLVDIYGAGRTAAATIEDASVYVTNVAAAETLASDTTEIFVWQTAAGGYEGHTGGVFV